MSGILSLSMSRFPAGAWLRLPTAVLAVAGGLCAQGVIVTVAGTDPPLPVGRPALETPVGYVSGVAFDRDGRLFLSLGAFNTVFSISEDGKLLPVAGNGFRGYSGDRGAAASASLASPAGLTFDSDGSLYIADALNHCVRKVAPGGIITTVAGIGTAGFSGDGGPATGAALDTPDDVAVDAGGNLFISDTGNNRIRKVGSDGVITTYAGDGAPRFGGDGGPAVRASLFLSERRQGGIALDAAGNLFIADNRNMRVRKVGPDGIITTVAGNGYWGGTFEKNVPAVATPVSFPADVAIDPAGGFYISESNGIRRVGPDGIITIIQTTRTAGCIAVGPLGGFYFADDDSFQLRKVKGATSTEIVAGNGAPFRFGGDGGPANTAEFYFPSSVVTDGAGNIFVADMQNLRIRKVGSDGVVQTVAGNGNVGHAPGGGTATDLPLGQIMGLATDAAGNVYLADSSFGAVLKLSPEGVLSRLLQEPVLWVNPGSTDTGPLKPLPPPGWPQSSVDIPLGSSTAAVAVDGAGNVYLASLNHHRVRKIAPDGTVTTVAGWIDPNNGWTYGGYSGDGGPAAEARLKSPAGVAVDREGNLYIVDLGNRRVRKVSPDGIITTIAGNGQRGYSGDGGPALEASFSFNWGGVGLAVDAEGNVYVADGGNARIRRISRDGIVTTVAGTGQWGFSGDGGPAVSASLLNPSGIAFDAAGNLLIADLGNNRVRAVLAAPPQFSVTPTELAFTAVAGGMRPSDQTVSAGAGFVGMMFSAGAATSTGGGWLSVEPVSGALPAALRVGVDQGSLAPGSYEGAVNITVPNANPASRRIPVRLTVTPPPPPKLGVSPDSLSFPLAQGAASLMVPLSVLNLGGGQLNFTAVASTTSGGEWLRVSPGAGTTTARAPAVISVTADPARLGAGVYRGSILLRAGADRVEVPVNLTVTDLRKKILLSQSGLAFTAAEQGGAPLEQSVRVLWPGGNALDWSLEILPVTGVTDWLKAERTGGDTIQVRVNHAGLAPGDYQGRLMVRATAADNSPQTATVILRVLPARSDPGPEIRAAALVFAGEEGVSPPPQELRIANRSGRDITLITDGLGQVEGRWFRISPGVATIQPGQPSTIRVYPDFSKLGRGVHRVNSTLTFMDGNVRSLEVVAVVARAANSGSAARRRASGCAPARLISQITSLGAGFSAPMFWPLTIEAKILDDCGDPVTSGSVLARFSNGDPQVSLVPVGAGLWVGTWQPRAPSAGGVRVTLTAKTPVGGVTIEGQTEVSGGLAKGGTPPLISASSVVNTACPLAKAVVAPGGLITIFGERLADRGAVAPAAPIPTELGGTAVYLAGRLLPVLSVSENQIEAQVNFDLSVNTEHQLVVRRGNELSLPEPITVAAAQPGVFTKDKSGAGQGMAMVGGILAEAASPARADDVVTLVCAGLGAVSPPVNAGTAGPADPPAATGVVEVSIGGKAARVVSSALAPGSVGVYHVTAVVPAGVPSGDAVPVVVTVAGQPSMPVAMAVR